MDDLDRALMKALAANARASGSALAYRLGVAESTVSHRLKKLQADGHIRGYRADIDLACLGVTLQALIAIRLVKHVREEVDEFRDAAPHWPGVLALFHMGGADDYLLHVAARNAADLVQILSARPKSPGNSRVSGTFKVKRIDPLIENPIENPSSRRFGGTTVR